MRKFEIIRSRWFGGVNGYLSKCFYDGTEIQLVNTVEIKLGADNIPTVILTFMPDHVVIREDDDTAT